jgi:hypothetical protein
MVQKTENPLNSIKTSRIIWPILIGLGVVAWLLYNEFKGKNLDTDILNQIRLDRFTLIWLIISVTLMALRDIGYIIRLRILTDYKFSLRQTFRIIMLWEFTSAITPSAIGGTSVAILYLNKEGLSVGKSSAVVMATSFLDELYFIIMFPLLFLIINPAFLFIIGEEVINPEMSYINKFFWFAIIGYSIKLLYLSILSYGLFHNPRGLKWLLLKIFKLPILRRWKYNANDAGTDIINSARELRAKSLLFWLKTFAATFVSWTSRYWVVNALFVALALDHYAFNDHFLIFARQLVMWIMMLIMPTPGGSGAAEFIFKEFLGDFISVAGLAVFLSLVWRIATYYPYLFIGVFMFPRWIKSKFGAEGVKNQ